MTPEEMMYMPQNYGAIPQPPRNDRSDLLDKLKPEILVETVRQRLMGRELINGKWTKINALQDNALSEEGAWQLSNLMLATASLNTSISKLEDHEIKRRILGIAESAQYLCIANWQKYGIKNTAQLWFVHQVIFTNSLVVFKQADGASIQELLKGTTFEQRNIMTEMRPRNKLLSALGFGGNR